MSTAGTVSLEEARSLAVAAQGLGINEHSSSSSILKILGCIQIDSIQVVRRSQELVLLSRGVLPEELPISNPSTVSPWFYESFAHAYSLIPVSFWPMLAWRRRRSACYKLYDRLLLKQIVDFIKTEGPSTPSQLKEGLKNRWDPELVRLAAEGLLSVGCLSCLRRTSRYIRVYDLTEHCLPENILYDLPEEEGINLTVQVAMEALGIATVSDVADYFRMEKSSASFALESGEYEQVSVESSQEKWYVSPHARLCDGPQCMIPLSPLDSLVWTRPRQEILFGRDYRAEFYKPESKRQFGYYAMPLLQGNNLVGRISARKKGRNLLVENVECDIPIDDSVYSSLLSWTGCESVISI